MRMWHPDLVAHMCRKHLLGQHVELHMILGSIKKKKSLKGFIDKQIVSPRNINSMHKLVVEEMLKRGYNHNSELIADMSTHKGLLGYCVWHNCCDVHIPYKRDLDDLTSRCPECRANLIKAKIILDNI